jgi:hypothetical protein
MVYELAAASDSQHRFRDAEKQSDVASQPDGDLQRRDQDRNASKAWAMRMPTLRTTKNAVMASNMQISCATVPVKALAHLHSQK